MKLVFQETSRNALSFGLLLEFYSTANRMCEELFGVTAPKGFSEIRLQHRQDNRYIRDILFVIKLTGSSEADIESAKQKWKAVGESYKWKLLGRLKENADIADAIDGEFLPEDWHERYD